MFFNASKTKFKYIDRGKLKLAVLIPGWATDHTIFGKTDLDFNYLVPSSIDVDDFEEVLDRNLRWSGAFMIGWSFGGLLAANYMAKNPQKVKKAVFVGVRRSYAGKKIDMMSDYLLKNKRAYLRHFYAKCLRGHDDKVKRWFNLHRRERYLWSMSLKSLAGQLGYMASNEFPCDRVKARARDMLFVRGENDALVSAEDHDELRHCIPRACFKSISGAGHLAFMAPGFKAMVDEWSTNG